MRQSARRLRIASVCRTLPTPENRAAGTFVASRLAALAKLTSLRIVQPVPYFPVVRPLPEWLNGGDRTLQGVPVEAVPMFYLPRVLKSLDGRWLARCTGRKLAALGKRQWRADVIDAHFGYPDGVGCVRVAQALGLPVFITIRGSETDFLRQPAIARQLVHALNTATGCISVSHSLRRLVAEHGVDADKVRVIPNAVNREIFRPGPRGDARRELGVDSNARLIVSVGHLVALKGHEVLIRAVHRLVRRYPTIQLMIFGGRAYERDHPAELQGLIRELGLTPHVRLLGLLDQDVISSWLRAADLFALATEREGCCNAVLEALATGTPVITTPVGDNTHFVHAGINGSVVPVGDVGAFERTLADALERSWDQRAISQGLEVGDWDHVAGRVLEFFTERLDSAGRSRE
jgi:glycosyltransferase involved in cell wall biosynthesis